MRIFLLLTVLFTQFLIGNSRTLYVDPVNGNSAYDGSSPTFLGGNIGPKQTPQQAINLFQAGDTIRLANGTYNNGSPSIIDIKNQDGLVIIGENRDSVIIDGTNKQFAVSISTSTTNPNVDVQLHNLTVINTNGGTSPAHILIWEAERISLGNITIEGPGQFNAPGDMSTGIKIMETDSVSLRNVTVRSCEGNGIEVGGGSSNLMLHNIEVFASSSDLGTGGILLRTPSAGIFPSGDISIPTWTGNLELDSCYIGIYFDTQSGTISLDFSGNSVIEDNFLLDAALFGSSTIPIQELKELGFNFIGTLGILPGVETYFAARDDLLALTTNPTYVASSIASDIDRTIWFVEGAMKTNLPVNNASSGDTIAFIGEDFSTVEFLSNNELYIMAEDGLVRFKSFNVNGTPAFAKLINNFEVIEELILTKGNIETDNFNRLTLEPGCLIIGGSDISHVDGPLNFKLASSGNSVLSFPLGNSGKYRRVDLNIDQSNSDTSVYSMDMLNGAPAANQLPASLDRLLSDHHWTFSVNGNNFNNAIPTLAYNNPDGVNDTSSLRVAFSDDQTNLNDLGGSGNQVVTGSITATSFSGPGELVLANSSGGGNFTGIDRPQDRTDILLYPNPARNTVFIQIDKPELFSSMVIIDMLGRAVLEKPIPDSGMAEITVDNLPNGYYQLLFTGSEAAIKNLIIAR